MSYPLVIASDHAGFSLKIHLIDWLSSRGDAVNDLGTHSATEPVDYSHFGRLVASEIANHLDTHKGIIICGSGIGISIAANRHPLIRAALCHNKEMASISRSHNDANVLALGARFISKEEAVSCVEAFVKTPFSGGRHSERVANLK